MASLPSELSRLQKAERRHAAHYGQVVLTLQQITPENLALFDLERPNIEKGLPGSTTRSSLTIRSLYFQRGVNYWEEALAICREIDDRIGESFWLVNLAVVYGYVGMKDKAISYYKDAIPILEAVQSPETEAVRGWLAELEKR